MKTTLYAYRFNLTDADQRAAYESMAAALKAQGLKKFRSWGGGSHYLPVRRSRAHRRGNLQRG